MKRQTRSQDQMVFAQAQTAKPKQEGLKRSTDPGAKEELVVGRRLTERPERLLGVRDKALPQVLVCVLKASQLGRDDRIHAKRHGRAMRVDDCPVEVEVTFDLPAVCTVFQR